MQNAPQLWFRQKSPVESKGRAQRQQIFSLGLLCTGCQNLTITAAACTKSNWTESKNLLQGAKGHSVWQELSTNHSLAQLKLKGEKGLSAYLSMYAPLSKIKLRILLNHSFM